MDYSYPLASAAELVERIDAPPTGVKPRRWVLRDDNQRHYHGLIPLLEDPAYIELFWKSTSRGQEQRVGLFRLHLARLVAAHYARLEANSSAGADQVWLRFYRGDRNRVCIQVNSDGPALAIGVIDASIG
jgi:hypothetical protein